MIFDVEEIEFILGCEENSITDRELIRRIALSAIEEGTNFISKVKSGYSFCGLYPCIQNSYGEIK